MMSTYAGGVPEGAAGTWMTAAYQPVGKRPPARASDQTLNDGLSLASVRSGVRPAAHGLRWAWSMSAGFDRAAREAFVVVVAALSALVGGCAPEMLAMNVPNPATGANAAGAMQSYEIPPNREDHRYEVTLSEWTPSSLACHVRFLNADRCGLSSSYSLELVDDAGRHYPFHPTGVVREATTFNHVPRRQLTHASDEGLGLFSALAASTAGRDLGNRSTRLRSRARSSLQKDI